MKLEARNPKSETNHNDRISNDQNKKPTPMTTLLFGSFGHSNFEIVSDFDIRISGLG